MPIECGKYLRGDVVGNNAGESLSNLFPLFPSEAVLVGRIFAEWEPPSVDVLPNYDGPIFFECLRDGLRPFVPDMTLIRERVIDRNAVPSDIEWSDLKQGRQGTSKAMPNCLYREDPDRVLEIRFDDSRNSLIDLMAILLSDCIAMPVTDYLRYRWKENDSYGSVLARQLATILAEREPLRLPAGKDDATKIKDRLRRVACSNGLEAEFDLGIAIGSVLALIRQSEFYIEHSAWLGDYDEILLEEKWPHPLPLSPFQLHAATQPWLSKILNRWDKCLSSSVQATLEHFRDNDRFSAENDEQALRQLRSFREAVVMTLGQVLIGLQSADVLAREKDMKSAYPRTLPKLSADAASERVGGMLEVARQLLSGTHPAMVGPETLLGMLTNGVEATVRDACPDVGRSNRSQSDLQKRLDDMHKGDALEKRFAHHARHLLSQYRNPASHDLNTIECSWSELQHFVHGLTALREMADKLKRRNHPSND